MSAIDPSLPVEGTPTTQSVRDNFAFAASEIDALDLNKAERLELLTQPSFIRTPQEFDGEMITPQTILAPATTTAGLSPNVLRLIPFVMPRTGMLQDLKFNVTVLGAGNCRIGLYFPADDTNATPGALLYDSGDIAINATGIKVGQPMADFNKGQVLFAALLCSISATWTTIAAANVLPFWPIAAGSFGVGRNLCTTPQPYGALPTDLSAAALTITSGTAPLLGISM